MGDAEFEMRLLQNRLWIGFRNHVDSNPCDVLTLRIQYDGLQLGYAARLEMTWSLHMIYTWSRHV